VKRSAFFFLMLVFVVVSQVSIAQSFKLMRYDEDYFQFADSIQRSYYKLKYIPLSKNKEVFMSTGGEIRYEFAAFNNEDWGRRGVGRNNFLLQRYNVHADLHVGKIIRLFGQVRSALEDGRKNGPRPIDEDRLNVQNLFLDIKLPGADTNSFLIRIGRQELDYGSNRLVSVREGPNVRFYFDGLKLVYKAKSFVLDGFVIKSGSVYPGVFDNKSLKRPNFWGVYSSSSIPLLKHLDIYYLGKNTFPAQYEDGTFDEHRHTIGSRIWGQLYNWKYDVEGAYQFGKFGTGKICAYTVSLDLGYQFESVKMKPFFGIRNDYISGDERRDTHLQTFNPLYPKGGYFGFNPLLGAANLIDIHPYAYGQLSTNCTMLVDLVFNWRYSLTDGLYRPSGLFNLAADASSSRYVGTAYLLKFAYKINPFLSVDAAAQYFNTGPFIADIIRENKNAFLSNYRVVFKF
jgi:hypothetical protein